MSALIGLLYVIVGAALARAAVHVLKVETAHTQLVIVVLWPVMLAASLVAVVLTVLAKGIHEIVDRVSDWLET